MFKNNNLLLLFLKMGLYFFYHFNLFDYNNWFVLWINIIIDWTQLFSNFVI